MNLWIRHVPEENGGEDGSCSQAIVQMKRSASSPVQDSIRDSPFALLAFRLINVVTIEYLPGGDPVCSICPFLGYKYFHVAVFKLPTKCPQMGTCEGS
jgi:hypothetical protein